MYENTETPAPVVTMLTIQEADNLADTKIGQVRRDLANNINKTLTQSLQDLVDSGDITESQAHTVWDSAMKWLPAHTNPFTCTWTVEVRDENGQYLFDIEGVEADDDDEACEKVRDDLTIEEATIHFKISHTDGAEGSGEHSTYDYDTDKLIESLSLTAERDGE